MVESQLEVKNWVMGEGRCQVSLMLIDTGSGIQGLLTGGEKPHVGGTVLAVPRISLSGHGWSADLYSLPVPSHKDVEVAGPLAKELARITRCPVVLTAGIHSENITQEEIDIIAKNCSLLAQKVKQSFNS